VQCHLGGFEGNSGVPRVAGQYPEYLEKTMRDYKTKARNNAPDKSTLLASFSDEQITGLAALLGGI
jgi:cytochrome c553